MKCPYCLRDCTPNLVRNGAEYNYRCNRCSEQLDRDLVEKWYIKRINIGLVGFSGHGKTCFITSLFFSLKNLLGKGYWPDGFLYRCLDDHTNDILFQQVPCFESAELPPGTPQNFPKPAVIKFDGIPYYGDRIISFYDVAGGVYEESDGITDSGRFVAAADVVFFMISLNDCDGDLANSSERLLQTYIQAVYNRLHIKLKRTQHLVVVLTKGDKIYNLPVSLQAALRKGSCSSYVFPSHKGSAAAMMRQQMESSRKISDMVRQWLTGMGCRGFCTLAESSFKSVSYVLVSATGSEPVMDETTKQKKLPARLLANDPKCVIDPFLLALEKTSRPDPAKILAYGATGIKNLFRGRAKAIPAPEMN